MTPPTGCCTVTPPSSCTLTRTPGTTTFTRELGGGSLDLHPNTQTKHNIITRYIWTMSFGAAGRHSSTIIKRKVTTDQLTGRNQPFFGLRRAEYSSNPEHPDLAAHRPSTTESSASGNERRFRVLRRNHGGPFSRPGTKVEDETDDRLLVDAVHAYRDLTGYRIQIVLEADGWHIDYQLKEPKHKRGGPHYVIDARSGEISSKRHEQ
jgi:hypothetical protein